MLRRSTQTREAKPRLRRLFVAFLVIGAFGADDPAQAFTVHYDGPEGLGVGESNALDAAAAGVPIVSGASLFPIDAYVDDVTKTLDLGSIVDPPSPTRADPIRATSEWEITFSAAAGALAGPLDGVWLLLTRSSDFPAGSVGLDLDPALGWALIEAMEGDETFYYPAVDIGPPPLDAPTTETVHYRVATELPIVDGVSMFPQFQGGLAVLPIPEPATWVLLSLGLTGLLGFGRRG